MPKLNRRMVIQTALEAQYSVDPGTGYNAILTNVGTEIQPNAEIIQRETIRRTYSPQGHVVGSKDFQITLPIELKGGGLDGSLIQAPEVDHLLRACSMVREDGLVISVTGVTGTFALGEVIAEGLNTVGILADIVQSGSTATLYIRSADVTPADTDTLTGETSAATATVSGTPATALVYRPTSDRDLMGSAVCRYNLDGIQHLALGVRGTFNLDLSVGRYGAFSFDLRGLYADPTDVVLPSVSYSAVVPAVVFSAGLQIGSWDMSTTAATNLAVNINNSISPRNDMNAADGRRSLEIIDRDPNGSVNPEVVALSTYNPWTLWKSAASQKLYAQIGSEAGNRVRILVPAAVYGNLQYAERDGIAAYQMPFTCVDPGREDEELMFFFS